MAEGLSIVDDWKRLIDYIRSNDIESVREWLNKTPCSQGNDSLSQHVVSDPVYVAADVGNIAIFDLLIHHDFKPDRITRTKHRAAQPIHTAAVKGHLEIVKRLIGECDIPVNTETNTLKTPLYLAAAAGHTDVVEYLVSKGADLNYCSSLTSCPIVAAVQSRHYALAQLMQKHGADINVRVTEIGSFLNYNVSVGAANTAEWLFDNGARTDILGEPDGCSLFHYGLRAPRSVCLDTLKFLVRINVPLNEVTSEGHSALYCMLCDKYTPMLPDDCLRLVVDAGYHVIRKDYEKACQVWHDETGLTQLQSCLSHPRTLQQLCCFAVRERLGLNLHKFVDHLPVLSSIKNYIKLAHLVNS